MIARGDTALEEKSPGTYVIDVDALRRKKLILDKTLDVSPRGHEFLETVKNMSKWA